VYFLSAPLAHCLSLFLRSLSFFLSLSILSSFVFPCSIFLCISSSFSLPLFLSLSFFHFLSLRPFRSFLFLCFSLALSFSAYFRLFPSQSYFIDIPLLLFCLYFLLPDLSFSVYLRTFFSLSHFLSLTLLVSFTPSHFLLPSSQPSYSLLVF
jgi:hypothetical protein